jgi:arylsulfatase A-like enzyme
VYDLKIFTVMYRNQINRIPDLILLFGIFVLSGCAEEKKPNVVLVFADQWRVQDLGYAGNEQVKTPNLDMLAEQAVVFRNAVANIPVCTPARASLMTGQYPLTHGVFYNDKPLATDATCIAEVYKENGYNTGYIGKWHINGGGIEHRNEPVPKERRQGFDFWKVHECTHNYNNSVYYDEENVKHTWEGYDAIAQTKEAVKYIYSHKDEPFVLFLSWGPPHAPYETAPKEYKELYKNMNIQLRPNVPEALKEQATEWIRGYYSHITALDDCVEQLQNAIKEAGIEDNTIFVFTSDHGDMLGSHGEIKKQKPWEESIAVPMVMKYPEKLQAGEVDKVFSYPDIMPTLLGLCKLEIPETVEGIDFSGELLKTESVEIEGALITCPVPFHQWSYKKGGREFRAIRTERYTYAKDLNGPWLLYDNLNDPYQMNNLCNNPEFSNLRADLEKKLQKIMEQRRDEFLEGELYMKKWNYTWDMDDSVKIIEE